MNEHIQELADKIWGEGYLGNTSADKLLQAQLNKFAESIVRECVSISAKENWKTLGVDMKGLKQFDRGIISGRKIMSKELCDKIEEHFGIKQ